MNNQIKPDEHALYATANNPTGFLKSLEEGLKDLAKLPGFELVRIEKNSEGTAAMIIYKKDEGVSLRDILPEYSKDYN